MTCKYCNSNIEPDSRFCPQCGAEYRLDALVTDSTVTALVPSSQVLAVSPLSSSELHSLLTQANLFRQRREWDAAINCCITVLRVDPGNPTAHALLGEIYYGQHKLHDAVHWFRLAVELHPNPNDRERLRELEEEARRGSASELVPSGKNAALSPIHADGNYSTGTAQLMGLPPRTYLNIITAVSLAFTSLMLVAILVSRSTRKIEKPNTIASDQSIPTATVLPPPTVSLQNINPKIALNLPANVGSQIAKNRDAGQPRRTPEDITKLLPLAPIMGVRSLPPDSAPKTRPDMINESPKEETSKPPIPTLSLPEGMSLANTHRDPVSGAVSLLVVAAAQSTTTLTNTERVAMLRNVYRAARIHFSTELKSQRVVVYVQSRSEGATVMLAEISRMTADAVNPENETPDNLESRLISLKTVDSEGNSRPVPNGTASNQPAPSTP